MQYNGHATEQDIIHEAHFWAGTDADSWDIKDQTRSANFAQDRVGILVMRSDNSWKWDDDNQTDLPIALGDIISGREDYAIPVSYLKIGRIRLKDRNGNFFTPTPKDRREIPDDVLRAAAGDPLYYSKIGRSVFLTPPANYGSVEGFEIQFQRGPSYFTTTDTTKEPGFDSMYHRLVPLFMARDFCTINRFKDRLVGIKEEIETLMAELGLSYTARPNDERKRLTTRREDYGSGRGARSGDSNRFVL